MSAIIINIGKLLGMQADAPLRGAAFNQVTSIEKAWLYIADGKIKEWGSGTTWQNIAVKASEIIDAEGGWVMPAFCDSHTHIVFDSWREKEFEDRINGLTYQEIFARGGGILNSVERLRQADEIKLYHDAHQRLHSMMMSGTAAVEIKSGYGLNLESELKMLRVIRKLKDETPVLIKSTFLGAHAVPQEFKNNKQGYVNVLVNEMIPAIAAEGLADFCDVFCEQDYFTADDTKHILETASKHGMKPKVHAEQLSHSNGIAAGITCNATSVDHLEYCNDADIEALSKSNTIATLLPGAQFFLSLPKPPARALVNAGAIVALATDFNPGSSPMGNMLLMMSLACINYKLTPQQSFNAATINGAYAMDCGTIAGSIAIGKKANLIIMQPLPSLAFMPYAVAHDLVKSVFVNGIKQ